MKDTIITVKRKKIELITFLVCFIVANLINLYAINTYDTPIKELYTQIGYICIVSIILYIGWSVLRIIFYSVIKLVKTKK